MLVRLRVAGRREDEAHPNPHRQPIKKNRTSSEHSAPKKLGFAPCGNRKAICQTSHQADNVTLSQRSVQQTMRQIGNLPDESKARVFGDFLLAHGIKNNVEHDTGAAWCVWVLDEDRIADAQAWLEKFRSNPGAPEFRKAAAAAPQIRKAEERDLAEYQRRVRTAKSIFPSLGGYGVGILTYLLIIGCAIVAVYTKLGSDRDLLTRLFISEDFRENAFLPEIVKNGEVWRLFTPMFIHFGPIHFIFNVLWLYQLGCMIEARQSWFVLLSLVLVSQISSAMAQYLITGPAFGGMSGVVYALVGYVWIRGKFDRNSGVFLDSQNLTYSLVWLVLCFTGVLGPIGNWAHLAGLITGMIWGRISAWFASRRPE